jgi:protein involved in polysaccharide export with SLBB domain
MYLWKEGMCVSDLIPSRAFLITRDYWNQQNHLVRPESGSPFATRLTDAPGNLSTDVLGNPNIETLGKPRTDEPGSIGADAFENARGEEPTGAGSKTIASIGKNSAEINWEYALIERLDERDLSTRLIPFNLGRSLDNPASADNQPLKPGDVVTIFSRADLELPMEKHASFVRIGGEVNAPGVYRVNPGDTLRDVLERAGGLTLHSYLYASIFTRISTRTAQEAQLRQSSEQMQRELVTKFANATPQAGQSTTDQQAQLSMQQSALARLTSTKATGRVVLSMKPEAATVADIPDFPLEDGDAFYIPPRLSTVQVAGAVYNANAFRYLDGERLVTYLNDAGGTTREADQKRIFVIRADGTVVSRQSRNTHFHGGYENLRLLPGDAIVVPEKLRVSSKMSDIMQATQFASQTALTAAALSVIK